jgi:DNA adenine methylase
MEANFLHHGHYLEPYAGGAGVALDLLFSGKASHIHINDVDPAVFAFWIAATKHAAELLELLHRTPICMDEWFKWRAVLRGEINATTIERGFATLYMNRTNRSGILNAGVIGGLRQQGDYKLDARFKKDVIATRLERISAHAEQISVYCEDSLALLGRCNEFLPSNSLIYLDPPYYIKGKQLYRNFYAHEDHEAIATLLQRKDFN